MVELSNEEYNYIISLYFALIVYMQADIQVMTELEDLLTRFYSPDSTNVDRLQISKFQVRAQ